MQAALVMPRVVAAVSPCAYQAHQALAALERTGIDSAAIDGALDWAISSSSSSRGFDVAAVESRLKWALGVALRRGSLPTGLEFWYRLSTRLSAALMRRTRGGH